MQGILKVKLYEKNACFKVIGVQWIHIFAARKRFLKTFFNINICHFKTIYRTAFLSFYFFDFIKQIEKFHFIHI